MINNTTEKNENEETLMSEEEMDKLIRFVIADTQEEPYVLDGMSFLFHTLGKIVDDNNAFRVSDICQHLKRTIFRFTLDSEFYHDVYIQKVQTRLSDLNFYNESDQDVYHKIRSEYLSEIEIAEQTSKPETALAATESSNTKGVAKQISDLLNNPDLPARLINAIQDGLTEIYNAAEDQSAVNDQMKTPEYVEKVLSMATGKH